MSSAVDFFDAEIESLEKQIKSLKKMRDRALEFEETKEEDASGNDEDGKGYGPKKKRGPGRPKKKKGAKVAKKKGEKKKKRKKRSKSSDNGMTLTDAIISVLPTNKSDAVSPGEIMEALEEEGFEVNKNSTYQTINRLKNDGMIKSKKADGRGNAYWAK